MTKLHRILELQALVAADDSNRKAKTETEQAELKRLACALSAELKQPVYPVGMVAKFGQREATITSATKDADGQWVYTIDLQTGEFLGLGSGSYTRTEAEVRLALMSELGAMGSGQAYPVGVTVARRGVGGLVTAAVMDHTTGEWIYTLAGWPEPVAQSELTAALRGA